MTEITYLESVWHYDPYDDLKRLFELAGFPVRKVDTLDLGEPGVFITSPMNGDWREHLDSQRGKPRNAHLILWQLERPSGSAGSVGQYAQQNRQTMYDRYVDEVWVSDRRLAEETSLRYVTLGSHPGLGEPSEAKDWDVTHQSYAIPRRQTVYKHFASARVGPNCWPPERDAVLARSRLGLCVHQDNYPYMEPLRFALFAAWGLPILSETLVDDYPYGDSIATAPFDLLVATAEQMLRWEPGRLHHMGMKCRERMTGEFEFGKLVRTAVEQSVGDWR